MAGHLTALVPCEGSGVAAVGAVEGFDERYQHLGCAVANGSVCQQAVGAGPVK